MIKSIIFDLGRVVFTSDAVSYEGREKFAKEIGINPSFLQDFWFKRKNEMITGKMTEDKYLSDLIKESGIKMNIETLKMQIRGKNEIDLKMLEMIKKLKKKYVLCALTNDVKEWIEFRVEKFNLEKYFDLIISSSDYGFAKPDKRMYNLALQRLNVLPEETVFIDDREENLVSANEIGIKTFHFLNRKDFFEWVKKLNL